MRNDQLLNLLNEIELRADRTERQILNSFADENVDVLLSALRNLRNNARRVKSKVNIVTLGDIDHLQSRVTDVQGIAANLQGTFSAQLLLAPLLSSISDDVVGFGNLIAGLRFGLNNMSSDDLLGIVPAQELAAFQFAFQNNRVVLSDQPARVREREREIASFALDALVEQGAYIIDQLAQSNSSPRLRDAFGILQKKLEGRANIVQIGMFNQTCSRVIRGDIDELSGTLFELLRSHVESVFAALAQFEDWNVFCANATAISLDHEAISALSRSTVILAEDLRNRPEAASEVAEALDTVAAWADSADADRRDVLALTSTLRNFWSFITKSALAKEIATEGRKLAAKAIIGVLLTATTAGVLSAFGKIPGAEWIETTVMYFRSPSNTPPSGPPPS